MAKLWNYYSGEPFMENPHLAIVGNPKRRANKMARRRHHKSSGRKARVQSLTMRSNRRRRRKNPFPTAGIAINRPRRRFSHAGAEKAWRKRRHRRNPAILGVTMPPLQEIAWVGGGFIGTPMIEGFITKFLPLDFTTNTLGRYAVKVGSVIGLTFLAKQVMGIDKARRIALGGAAYVLVSAINEFLPQLTGATTTPAPATGAYRTGMINVGVGAYRTGMIRNGYGMGAYSKTGLAKPYPGLAASSLLPRWDLGQDGMKNPVYADPRFVNAPQVAR